MISFAVGMGFLLSSLMVFFHDVEFLWGVISTMWMYATPIIYSTGMLERSGAGWLAKVMQFNPLYHYVTFVRTIIIDGCSPAISEYFICAICSLVMIIIGGTVFKRRRISLYCISKFIKIITIRRLLKTFEGFCRLWKGIVNKNGR